MNFPKFMIRQTGGFAVGAISTKSRLASFAFSSASAIATTPRGSPSAPIRRTSFHRIWSLIRIVFLSIFHLRRELTTLLRDRLPGGVQERVDGHRSRVSPMPQPDRNRARDAGRRREGSDGGHGFGPAAAWRRRGIDDRRRVPGRRREGGLAEES